MDYVYSADINPAEREIDVEVECIFCGLQEETEVVAQVGHSETTYQWTCPRPNCTALHTFTIDNDKLFDNE